MEELKEKVMSLKCGDIINLSTKEVAELNSPYGQDPVIFHLVIEENGTISCGVKTKWGGIMDGTLVYLGNDTWELYVFCPE